MSADLSVVIAVRDGAPWIGEAIRSAAGADGLLEIVVVDDGSEDESAEAATAAGAAAPVRVIRRPSRGVAAARNVGVSAAHGSLIGFLDADDVWTAPAPDPRRDLLPDADIVHGCIQAYVGGRPHAVPFHNAGIIGLLVRTDAFDRIGPFDETLERGSDLDWFLRAREGGLRIARSDAVVGHYRMRPGTLSEGRGRRSEEGTLAAVAKSARRKGWVG